MAEQFHKIYISASEFVKAWEKEVYELTNLDYFIFILMNSIAEQLETHFFPSQNNLDEQFYLDDEEITNLAFHLGDSLQLFFDKNCFGICTFNCPTQLNQKVTTDDFVKAGKIPESAEFSLHACTTKEHCLKYDLMNYVIIDSILDFYRYDLSVVAEDDHPLFQQLIHFIDEKIIELIKKEGEYLLKTPHENATALFEKLMEFEENIWPDFNNPSFDEPDELEYDEPWKLSSEDLSVAIDDFKKYSPVLVNGSDSGVELFGKFINNFMGPLSVKDLTYEDLEEFLLVVFPTEFSTEQKIHVDRELQLFNKFLEYLDYNYETQLSEFWQKFKTDFLPELKRTFHLSHRYHQTHSYVEYQLSPEKDDPSVIDGFFEIVDRNGDLFVIEDIHLKDRYSNVDLSKLQIENLAAGDILNMQIMPGQNDSWQALWIECVFSPKAKFYLI